MAVEFYKMFKQQHKIDCAKELQRNGAKFICTKYAPFLQFYMVFVFCSRKRVSINNGLRGVEHNPYKQGGIGSNPISPTLF